MITVIDNPIFASGNRIIVEGEDCIIIEGHKFRLIDTPRDRPYTLVIAPDDWRFWRDLVTYRLGKSLRLIGKFIVVLLDIWGLADWDPVTVPVWECIRPLRWMARKMSMLKRHIGRVE